MATTKIPLSEKVEYLMTIGKFSVVCGEGDTLFCYEAENHGITMYSQPGGDKRFIQFINTIVEKYNLYPAIQKYLANKFSNKFANR